MPARDVRGEPIVSKRPDHITNTISGPCRGCGVYVKDAIHVDLYSADLGTLQYEDMPFYCAACCPLCNPREAS